MWLYVTGEEATKYVIPFHFCHVCSIVKPQHCARESLFSLCIASVDVDISGCMSVYVLLIYNFTSGCVHLHMHRENKPISLPEKQSSMKSAKAQVHKHSAEVNFTSSTLKNQVPTEREVRWDLQERHKEETAWFWTSPDRGCSSWESQVTHPQHVLGIPPCALPQPLTGAHAFSSGCSWSGLLFCHIFTSRVAFSLGSKSTGESKPISLSVPSCPCATSLPGTAMEVPLLCSTATGLVSL